MIISSRLNNFINEHQDIVGYDVRETIEDLEDFDDKAEALKDFVIEVVERCDYDINPEEYTSRNISEDESMENPLFEEDVEFDDFDTEFDIVDEDDEDED